MTKKEITIGFDYGKPGRPSSEDVISAFMSALKELGIPIQETSEHPYYRTFVIKQP